MPRRSQFEHLKSDVLAEFGKGLQPKDVYGKFPKIPPKTIRNWFQAQLPLDLPPGCSQTENKAGEDVFASHPPTLERQRSHLTIVANELDEDDSSLNDVQWVKRTVKRIVRGEKNAAIRVQALNTYLRAVQLEQSMKPAKLEVDLSDLSDQDLERLAAGEPLEAIAKAYES